MGYSLYVVGADGVPIADDMTQEIQEGEFFSANFSYMRRYVADLVDAGIGYWPKDPNLDTDAPPPFCNDEDCNVTYSYICCDVHRKYFQYTASEEPGISVYKLASGNDGYWVTKLECKSALKLWDSLPSGTLSWLEEFKQMLRLGSQHEGFRVW